MQNFPTSRNKMHFLPFYIFTCILILLGETETTLNFFLIFAYYVKGSVTKTKMEG